MSWFAKSFGKKFKKKNTSIIDPIQSAPSLSLTASCNPILSPPDHSSTQSLPVAQHAELIPSPEAVAEASAQFVAQAIDAPTANRPSIPITDAPAPILDFTTVERSNDYQILTADNTHAIPSQKHLASSSSMNVESSTMSSKRDLTLSNVTNNYYGKPPEISERQRKIADWLSPLNYPAIQKDTHEKVVQGTGQWLIHSPFFENWISQDAGTLRGTGIPGAGKTHLASIVVRHLQELVALHSFGTNNHATVVHVYCRYNDKLSTTQILASILKQLVEDNEIVVAHVERNLYNPCLKNKTQYTRNELLAALQDVLPLYSKLFIVIDGLDELHDDVRHDLVRTLMALRQRLFLTSRHIPLEGILTVDFEIRPPSTDFQLFITRELEQFPKINSLLKGKPEVLVEVTEAIESKSDGMFLLSALQLAALRGVTSVKSLRRAISQLPTTLADMYHLTLKRIKDQDDEEASLALRAILWVTHATRSMKIEELLMALSIDSEGSELDSEALTNESTLVSACFGLVTVEIENRTVRLVHFTAQDFFTAYRTGVFQAPHTHITDVCVTYLRVSGHDWKDFHLARGHQFDTFRSSRPFCDYACTQLGLQIEKILADTSTSEDLSQTVQCFLRSQPSLLLRIGPGQYDDVHVGTTVHFAAFYGLLQLIELLSLDINTFSVSGYTPLYYACRTGDTPMVIHLLSDSSIGVNDVVASREQMAPLHVAVWWGHDSIVKLLLATPGIDVEARTIDDDTALHIASFRDHGSIVKLLLSTPGIDVNAEQSIQFTPLHYAARDGHTSVTQQLLSCPGANINAKDKHGWTALHVACYHGRMQVVRLLLDLPGFDIDARTTGDSGNFAIGSTGLDFATKMGNYGVITLFKERGLHQPC